MAKKKAWLEDSEMILSSLQVLRNMNVFQGKKRGRDAFSKTGKEKSRRFRGSGDLNTAQQQ